MSMNKAASLAPMKTRGQRVMIVAGEASGDLHGGALAAALFAQDSGLEIVGFGGAAMRAAGVDVRFDIQGLGIVGLIEVLYHFDALLKAYRMAMKLLGEAVDLLVLIDFPDFNLRLAKAAKRLGICVVYYVSPQIWAWRSGRLRSIGACVDQMLVILPFEEEIYTQAGIPCEFVGHPLLDEFSRLSVSSGENGTHKEALALKEVLKEGGMNPEGTTIALLPGSRQREVAALLPAMLEALEALAGRVPGLQALIPVASSLPGGLVEDVVRKSPLPVCTVSGKTLAVFQAASAALVASGTATLQGALAGTPMVIVYKVSWLSYWISRALIRVKSIGLANIVADRPFIPELIQSEATPAKMAEELHRLLKNRPAREAMQAGLKEVARRLGKAGASGRAAALICRLLRQRRESLSRASRQDSI